MNLVQELGLDYFSDRCKNSMFFDEEGKACFLARQGWGGSRGAPATMVSGSPEKPETKSIYKPYDFFKDLSVFATPPLGWRMAAEGRYLAYFRRNNRAYHRGVAPHVLTRQVSPASDFLMRTGNLSPDHYENENVVVNMVMMPHYIKLREGIEAMRRGDLFSFCASPTVAVIPDVGEQQAIYFNTNRAGTVRPDGSINTNSPAIADILRELE